MTGFDAVILANGSFPTADEPLRLRKVLDKRGTFQVEASELNLIGKLHPQTGHIYNRVDTLVYNGAEQAQAVAGVKVGGLNVTYAVSGNRGTDVGLYTLAVTGTGNFTGTVTAQWKIWPDGIVQQVTPYDGIYDGTGHGITVAVSKPANATVKYAYAEQGPYAEEDILFTNVTETAVTVWYMVEAENYTTITNCGTVKRIVTLLKMLTEMKKFQTRFLCYLIFKSID